MRVDATSYGHAAREILRWARNGESRYVCVATVNNVIEAYDDPAYGAVMEAADLVTPDGMPLVWGLRLLGVGTATRVYGPDLTPLVCQLAAYHGVPIGLYGGSQDVLEALTARLGQRFPGLKLAYRASPPFRPLTADEERRTLEDLERSGARILFVGLGTPKQERWMAAHRPEVKAVMLGVGAAFDFLAAENGRHPGCCSGSASNGSTALCTSPAGCGGDTCTVIRASSFSSPHSSCGERRFRIGRTAGQVDSWTGRQLDR